MIVVVVCWFCWRTTASLFVQPDVTSLHREHSPGRMVSWTGPGFARVKDGAGLVFTVDNVPYAMDYDILIRYEPEVATLLMVTSVLTRKLRIKPGVCVCSPQRTGRLSSASPPFCCPPVSGVETFSQQNSSTLQPCRTGKGTHTHTQPYVHVQLHVLLPSIPWNLFFIVDNITEQQGWKLSGPVCFHNSSDWLALLPLFCFLFLFLCIFTPGCNVDFLDYKPSFSWNLGNFLLFGVVNFEWPLWIHDA